MKSKSNQTMSKADSDNQIGELKSKLTSVKVKIVKCESELKMELAKLDNARRTETADDVQIYEMFAKQKHTELKAYLNLKLYLEGIIASLEYHGLTAEIKQSVTDCMIMLKQWMPELHEDMVRLALLRLQEDPLGKFGEANGLEEVKEKRFVELKKFDLEEVKEKRFVELKKFEKDPPDFCSAGLVDEDILHWQGTIVGPAESPFDGGLFLVHLHFSPDYPGRPPKVSFKTKVFHPNIDSYGTIGLDILKEKWSPDLSISRVLSIFSLLAHPNFDEPLVPDIAQMGKTDRAKYESTARSWTQMYAMG